MADERMVNGDAVTEGDDQLTESFYDFGTETKANDLVKKVEVSEKEKVELMKENEEVKEKGKKLEAEVLELRSEKERMEELVKKAEEDGKALGVKAGRAADLETEISRLQHDLVNAMSEADDANKELKEVKQALEEIKVWAVKLKKEKAVAEAKVSELESKVKEVEEDARIELSVKECDLNAVMKVEASEAKVSELETKLILLQKKAEKVVSELKENTAEAFNGGINRDAGLVNGGSKKGIINLQWPMGAGVSAVVIGGAICLLCAKKR